MYNNRFVDDAITENWANIVQTLYNLPQDINAPEDQYGDWEIRPVRMPLDSQAQTLYARYFDSISDETNRAEDEISAAVITKYDSHVMRLALVLRMLWWAEEEATDWEIGLEELQSIKINATAMQGAIKLAGYFKHTSLKVVNRLGSPVDQLEDKYRLLYSKMPDEITREQAIDLAKVAGISERSLARFMNRQNLFRRVGQGRYAKLLEY
jgi:hypothetical protein